MVQFLSLVSWSSCGLAKDELASLGHHEVDPTVITLCLPLATVVELVAFLMLNKVPELCLIFSSPLWNIS